MRLKTKWFENAMQAKKHQINSKYNEATDRISTEDRITHDKTFKI